jgi:hypothetical protein
LEVGSRKSEVGREIPSGKAGIYRSSLRSLGMTIVGGEALPGGAARARTAQT